MFTGIANWVGSWIGKNTYSHLNLPSEYDIPPNENFVNEEVGDEPYFDPNKDYFEEGMPKGYLSYSDGFKKDNYLLAGGFLLITYFCLK